MITGWIRSQTVKLACRIVPSLRYTLQRTGPAIELLEGKLDRAVQQGSLDDDFRHELLSELDEAIAMSDGAPWRADHKPASSATGTLVRAREAVTSLKLRETIYGTAELELALEDRGWKRLIAQSQYEFSRFGI